MQKEKPPISLIQHLITLGTVVLFSSYFFTRGYIHSFALPIRANFSESGYFVLSLIADSVLPPIFSIVTSIWCLMIILVIILRKKLQILRIHWFSKFIKNLSVLWKNIAPLTFLIFFIFIISICKFILDTDFFNFSNLIDKPQSAVSYDEVVKFLTSSQLYKIFYHLQNKIMYKLYIIFYGFKSFIFLVTVLVIVFAIPLFIVIFINFLYNIKHLLIFLLIIIISASSSYSLGRNYLSKFINYPKYRVDSKTIGYKIQIWRDKNYYFYVECKKYGVSFIKGENTNGKLFYVGTLIRDKHPTLCK